MSKVSSRRYYINNCESIMIFVFRVISDISINENPVNQLIKEIGSIGNRCLSLPYIRYCRIERNNSTLHETGLVSLAYIVKNNFSIAGKILLCDSTGCKSKTLIPSSEQKSPSCIFSNDNFSEGVDSVNSYINLIHRDVYSIDRSFYHIPGPNNSQLPDQFLNQLTDIFLMPLLPYNSRAISCISNYKPLSGKREYHIGQVFKDIDLYTVPDMDLYDIGHSRETFFNEHVIKENHRRIHDYFLNVPTMAQPHLGVVTAGTVRSSSKLYTFSNASHSEFEHMNLDGGRLSLLECL